MAFLGQVSHLRKIRERSEEVREKIVKVWWSGREARLGTANPATRVQIPSPPPDVVVVEDGTSVRSGL